jgi:metal-responsive CopG/Arc/MetJ family transcriptional regulator
MGGIMHNKENIGQIMVYMPKELIKTIDKDRGSFSRSRFIATLTEMYYEELNNYGKDNTDPNIN